MTDPELCALVTRLAAQIGEHASAVQILVSVRMDGGGTGRIMRGCGDWYARQGLAHEFINDDLTRDMATKIADSIKPEN